MSRLVFSMTLACLASAYPVLPAQAKNFDERESLRARSKSVGLAAPSVEVMTVDASLARSPTKIMASARAASLVPGPAVKATARGNRTTFIGDGWRLEVSDDGTAADFRAVNPPSTCRPLEGAYPDDKHLEAAARTHLFGHLGDLVGIDAEDALVPYKTRHELRSSWDTKRSTRGPTEICSSTVVFSRRVGSIDVVGSGSKVRVTLDPDGVLVGWSFDWPPYMRTSSRQSVLDRPQIEARSALVGVPWADTTTLHNDMECGLYDPGYRVRRPSTRIQAGCVVHALRYDTTRKEGRPNSSFIDVVPIGVEVFEDPSWAAATRYCGVAGCAK